MDALRAPVLWLTVESSVSDGRECRDYVIDGDDGTRLGSARAFPWRRDIPLHLVPAFDVPTLMLPSRLGDRLFNRAPRGWKLQNTMSDAQDPRLRLAAALFAVELSHW